MNAANSSKPRIIIDDVAKAAGVSTATVSRVINETGPVSEATRQKVLDAVNRLNYRPTTAAQILAGSRTRTIGLLFSEISGDFFSPLLRGIEAVAQDQNYGLLVYATHGGDAISPNKPLLVGDHNCDGAIVFVDSLTEQALSRLTQNDFPVVLIHHSSPPGLQIPTVTVENKKGSFQVVEHLIVHHGYKRIGFLAGLENHEDSYWREMGYQEAMESYGLTPDPRLRTVGGFDREIARKAILEMMSSGVEIDAIFAGDDESAIGVYTALESLGIRIPEDIAVVGFDDTYLSSHLNPPLTTVKAPIEEVGRCAVKHLLEKINGDTVEPITLLPTELVLRQSCGCNITE